MLLLGSMLLLTTGTPDEKRTSRGMSRQTIFENFSPVFETCLFPMN